MTNEQLVKGEDISELFKKSGETSFSFEFAGKEWGFTYKELSWQEHFQAIEDAWDLKTVMGDNGEDESERSFNAARYYEDVLLRTVVKCPGGVSLTGSYLRQLDSKVIAKMLPMVPSPLLGEGLAGSKKDLPDSTDEEEQSA